MSILGQTPPATGLLETTPSGPPRRAAAPQPQWDFMSDLKNSAGHLWHDYSSVVQDAGNRVVSDYKPAFDADAAFLQKPSLNSYGHMAAQNFQSGANPMHMLDVVNDALSPISGVVHAAVAPYTRAAGRAAYRAGWPVGNSADQAAQNVDAGVGLIGGVGAMAVNSDGILADIPSAEGLAARLQARVADLHPDPRTIEDLHDAAANAPRGAGNADALNAQARAAQRAFNQFGASSGKAFATRSPGAVDAPEVSSPMDIARAIGTRRALGNLVQQNSTPKGVGVLSDWAGSPGVRDGMRATFGDRGDAFMDGLNDDLSPFATKGWGYSGLNSLRGKIPSSLSVAPGVSVPFAGDALKWGAGKALDAVYDAPSEAAQTVTQGAGWGLPMAGAAHIGSQPWPATPAPMPADGNGADASTSVPKLSSPQTISPYAQQVAALPPLTGDQDGSQASVSTPPATAMQSSSAQWPPFPAQ